MRSILLRLSTSTSGGRRVCALLSAVVAAALLASCSTTRFKESADREVYEIIETKSTEVPGMLEDFSIEPTTGADALDDLPVNDVIDPALGETGADESGATVLSLEQALALAVTNSRAYQNRKEALYLEALSLSLDRHRYAPIFSGGAGAEYARTTTTTNEATELSQALGVTNAFIDELEAVTGTPADLLNAYAAVVEQAGDVAGLTGTEAGYASERTASAGTSAGVDWLLKGGGRIAVDLTSNFLRFLTGDTESITSSVLSATVTQPLLRGAGAKVSAERLTQAERDVLYALRDFSRFRQQFTVQVAAAYYQVLQNLDAVHNNWNSLENFRRNAERERDFATEGRSTLASVGRQEAAELGAENSWINAVRNYRENLDEFKILLGLSTHTAIVLDPAELDELRRTGLRHPNIVMDDAVKVAFSARLDLYTERDRVEDAERALVVARNALLPDVTLAADASVRSQGDDNFQRLDFRRTDWNAGLDVDLPLDRKAERNAYRSTLIQYERIKRDLTLAEDTISLDVRSAWRNLESARRNFLVAQKSVDLNMRRVEEQELLAELGRGSALDQVDAQNELTQSQNGLTASLISHTLARLQFWLDMGILYIKEDGQWEEVSDDYQQQL
ncbi:MAG: TolC family protein [Candidatus Hydrogenedentes bacterium]|nr:TolC family protein [Candidatus Hydrogenedentota bacterium]